MTTRNEIKSRIDRLDKAAYIAGEPQPAEVAYAMRYYHEHGGQFPEGTTTRTRAIAERLMASSNAMADIV